MPILIIAWIMGAALALQGGFNCSTACAHPHNDIREGQIRINSWSGCVVSATVAGAPVQLWAESQLCPLASKVPATFTARWDNTCKQLIELTDAPSLPAQTPTPSPSPTPVTPSIDGAKGATITDAQSNVWTVGPNGETLRNGTHVGGGHTKSPFYKYSGGDVYAVAKLDSNWYRWTGTIWTRVPGEPGLAVPTPTPAEIQYEFRKYRWPQGTTVQDEALQDAVEKQAAVEGWVDCQVVGNWLRCKRVKR